MWELFVFGWMAPALYIGLVGLAASVILRKTMTPVQIFGVFMAMAFAVYGNHVLSAHPNVLLLDDPTGLRIPFLICIWGTFTALVAIFTASLRLIYVGANASEFWAD